jgi:hypothetical protein
MAKEQRLIGYFTEAARELGVKLDGKPKVEVLTNPNTKEQSITLVALQAAFPCWGYAIDIDPVFEHTVESMKRKILEAGREGLEKATKNMGLSRSEDSTK